MTIFSCAFEDGHRYSIYDTLSDPQALATQVSESEEKPMVKMAFKRTQDSSSYSWLLTDLLHFDTSFVECSALTNFEALYENEVPVEVNRIEYFPANNSVLMKAVGGSDIEPLETFHLKFYGKTQSVMEIQLATYTCE